MVGEKPVAESEASALEVYAAERSAKAPATGHVLATTCVALPLDTSRGCVAKPTPGNARCGRSAAHHRRVHPLPRYQPPDVSFALMVEAAHRMAHKLHHSDGFEKLEPGVSEIRIPGDDN